MKELQKKFEQFKQELQDYNKLSKIDFLLKYEPSFKDDILKDYRLYITDNSDEDPDNILDYEEWKEEFEDEVSDDLQEQINTYFSYCSIEHFSSKYNDIWDVVTATGWPHIELRVESKWEKVTWKWIWWWDIYEWDLSYYYDTILDLYNLYINQKHYD